jgi:hypothetical protein
MAYTDDDIRVFRGRVNRGTGRGSDHRNAILTEDQAREIKWHQAQPRGQGMTRKQLAEHFGVSTSVIDNIRQRRTWSHVHIEEDA